MTEHEVEAQLRRRIGDLVAQQPINADDRSWLGARFDAGLAWVHYPPGRGGLGLARDWQPLVDRALGAASAGAVPPNAARNPIGLGMGAPTLVTHGTVEQQDRLLRPLWTGEEVWCQLFSEPGAGSDLAGLATRAVREDDGWRINGQKVWTSYAHKAHWAMLLARTDPDVPKHAGLSYFFLDMTSPGVEVRPLRQITGQAEFNEVFLADVFIPDSMRVGEVGDGWKIANTTLMNERVAIGGEPARRDSEPIASVLRLWNDRADLRTPELRVRVLKAWVSAEAARLGNERIRQQLLAGRPGPEGSGAKLQFAAINQTITRLRLELSGNDGVAYDDWALRVVEQGRAADRPAAYHYLRARANSIEGGTSEILLGVIADRILDLPREPRTDTRVPWREVPR